MSEVFFNPFVNRLEVACNPSATSLTLTNTMPFVDLQTGDTFRLQIEQEIMICTAVSGQVVTVIRGQENTTAIAHVIGVRVCNPITAGALVDFQSQISLEVAGALRTIDLTIGTNGTYTSESLIPANAIILFSSVTVTEGYSLGANMQVGQTGNLGLLQTTADIFPQDENQYVATQRTPWGATQLPVIVTITGSPSVGEAFVTVEYALPND